MESKKFNLLMSILGFALLIFLVKKIDFASLKNFSFAFTFWNIFVLTAVIFLMFLIKTWRWMVYLKAIGVKLKFWEAYQLVVPSIASALFTPAQTGDVLKIEFLKNHKKIPRRESFATVLVEKAMDFILVFVVFCAAIVFFSLKMMSLNLKAVMLAVALGLILFGIFVKLVLKRQNVFARIVHNTKKILVDAKAMVYSSILTIIYWALIGLNWVFVAKVVNLNISFFTMLCVLSVGTILGLISFIPGALGIMEYSTVFLFSTFLGVSSSLATLFALSSRVYSIIVYVVAYLHIFFKKI